jgi:ketosteroid isomerase-like protein
MIAHVRQTGLKTGVEDSVRAALMRWIEMVERRDLSLLPQTIWPDEELVWIGSGEAEWIRGCAGVEDALKAQNAALEDIRIGVSEETIHVAAGERYAWATSRWIFHARAGGEEIELPLRCTWVLEKRGDEWRIAHFHKSVGAQG